MIAFDHAARLQNRDLLMNRNAPDYIDYREERAKEERGISWEDHVGTPALPRRSPWNTANEDIESARPAASDKQVNTTPQNIQSVASTSGGATSSGSGISQSSLEAAVFDAAFIQRLTQSVLAALPIVEFTCPE
jgi:hypothetical protein